MYELLSFDDVGAEALNYNTYGLFRAVHSHSPWYP